jgi:predicted HNH restriction endonuclease
MNYKTLFENWGVKSVSQTDINKAAYVLDADQDAALRAAGHVPSNGGGTGSTRVSFIVLSGGGTKTLGGSYYLSLRDEKGRNPEARIGRAVVKWMTERDEVLIGNIGSELYIGKLAELTLPEVAQIVSDTTPEAELRKKALKAKGPPKKATRTVADFVRNPFVVAAALKRADGKCEVPSCTHSLFRRDTGSHYLEVHHIVPLGEGGDDTLLNVAAVCPACHRQHHFGTKRQARRDRLLNHILSLETAK